MDVVLEITHEMTGWYRPARLDQPTHQPTYLPTLLQIEKVTKIVTKLKQLAGGGTEPVNSQIRYACSLFANCEQGICLVPGKEFQLGSGTNQLIIFIL